MTEVTKHAGISISSEGRIQIILASNNRHPLEEREKYICNVYGYVRTDR
jgi:hypothetical protein